jgi:hypothetical protein
MRLRNAAIQIRKFSKLIKGKRKHNKSLAIDNKGEFMRTMKQISKVEEIPLTSSFYICPAACKGKGWDGCSNAYPLTSTLRVMMDPDH